MNFVYVVSVSGCILQVDAMLGAGLKNAGLEIFNSHDAAAARFTGSDVGAQPLVYFEALYE